MKHGWIGLFCVGCLLVVSQAFAADQVALEIAVANPGARVQVDRVVEEGKLVVSVEDTEEHPLLGLGLKDFIIKLAGRQANVTSVVPFAEEFDVPLNIILVLDNSDSMQKRDAVEPLKVAAGELLKTFRPIDRVSLIVFDKNNTISVDGRDLHVKILQTSDTEEMRRFLDQSYNGKHITYETWLYEAMLAGYDLLKKIPAEEQKFMVVFSDGEDRSSSVTIDEVELAAQGLPQFGAYAIDFMPSEEMMPALQGFASASQGDIWKAKDTAGLAPIFQEVATDLQRYYVVNYIFPPEGKLGVEPASLTIEEIKTLDASPMLGHIYFAEGESSIPEQYLRIEDAAQIAAFDESSFEDTLEKYYQFLNILGKRMTDNPEAAITLVGCNANTGVEKGNKALSTARAEAVRDYLQEVWSIDPQRLNIEARNLPAMPSTSRLDQGKADNRRVEVLTESPEILGLVRSTYIAYRADTSFLTIKPATDSAYGFSRWHVFVENAGGMVAERRGEENPPSVVLAPLTAKNFKELAAGGDLQVTLQAQDLKGQMLEVAASPVQVNFIQTSQLLAEQQDYLVQEKYALILFDFDSDSIGDRNQAIVAEIVARIRELPEAKVFIVGHTDNIGKEDYNLKLSERRAKSVYDQIIDFYGAEDSARITYQGVGADEPLYDNVSPEARAFNRTVTTLLEYMAGE